MKPRFHIDSPTFPATRDPHAPKATTPETIRLALDMLGRTKGQKALLNDWAETKRKEHKLNTLRSIRHGH